MRSARFLVSLLIVLALVVAGAATARAETVNCTAITALPAIITVQGIYCSPGTCRRASHWVTPSTSRRTT
jgi:hypothetical protein